MTKDPRTDEKFLEQRAKEKEENPEPKTPIEQLILVQRLELAYLKLLKVVNLFLF